MAAVVAVAAAEVNKEGEAFSSCFDGTADSKGDGKKLLDGSFRRDQGRKEMEFSQLF